MTRMSRILLLAAACAALGACASTPDQLGQVEAPRTPTEQWRAALDARPEEVLLAVRPGGLSATQGEALAVFVDRWREGGEGTITIQAPVAGADPRTAFETSQSARDFLIGQGVAPDQVRVVDYHPDAPGAAPLKIGYLKHTVVIPECGREWTNIAHSMTNQPQPNFGCAVTANMAAQIANPADLAGPRAMTPSDATRRAIVLDKYRQGQATSTAADEQAKAGVAK
jgi:pilus assembly protein CpaD